jgi:hypothetical protein
MIPNANITIYNKYLDARAEKFQRTVVFNCVWQGVSAISRFKEQIPANTILIMIPFSSGLDYQEPKAWQDDKTGWTLQEGDVIVRGMITDEITTQYGIRHLYAEHQSVVRIASIAAMDEGSPRVQHWEVQAK